MARERLQKFLAAAGVGSRRACEGLIRDGRVTVNGALRTELPVLIDPESDHIRVDGKRIKPEPLIYALLHKPKGVYCTNKDPSGRKRAVDLMGGIRQRVFPVGRLDADSTGLLLMTNDGELAQRLTHPRFGVQKTYFATVPRYVDGDTIDKLKRGIWLSEGKTQRAYVKVVHRNRASTSLEISLREGRNRQVRRMLAKLGCSVKQLARVRIGRLTLKGLSPGRFRMLTKKEVAYLKSLADNGAPASGRKVSSE